MSAHPQRILAAGAALGLALLAARGASAACCDLVKESAEPPSSEVRVCEVSSGPDCASPVFEGALGPGARVPICVAGETLLYREIDPALGHFGPPTEARCDGDTDVAI